MADYTPTDSPEPPRPPTRRGLGCLGVSLVIVGTVIVTLVLGALVARYVLFPERFEPVQLDAAEQQLLDDKLASLGVQTDRAAGADRFAPRSEEFDTQGRLRPEPYREAAGPHEVHFDERELNAQPSLAGEPGPVAAMLAGLLPGCPRDQRFVYYLMAKHGICVVPLSGFCCKRDGFRVTLLETDDARRRWTWQTIANALREYLG